MVRNIIVAEIIKVSFAGSFFYVLLKKYSCMTFAMPQCASMVDELQHRSLLKPRCYPSFF